MEGKGGGSVNQKLGFRCWYGGRQGGVKFKQRVRFKMMALWQARGGEV